MKIGFKFKVLRQVLAVLAPVCAVVFADTAKAIGFESMSTRALPLDTTVSFVTFYPGPDVYELEGHSALRITTPQYDVAVSYGMFDFDSPNFVYRFLRGQTDYGVGLIDWSAMYNAYASQNRRVVQQVLDLDGNQKRRLLDIVADNLLPEKRTYRYNYVQDNCATRPLRAVELAIGDSLVLGRPHTRNRRADSAKTWRQAMTAYHANYPWYQFGIDLVLGSGIDRAISHREKAFAPVSLDAQLRTAHTAKGKKIVKLSQVLNDVPCSAAIQRPTPWFLTPVFVGWLYFAVSLSVCLRAYRRNKISRWYYTLSFGIFSVAGCLIAFLVFASEHPATSPNFNLVWLNPLCLLPVILIWLPAMRRILKIYFVFNFAAVAVLALSWPFLPQSGNVAFVPFAAADMLLSLTWLAVAKRHKA